MQAIQIKTNSNGIKYALTTDGQTFGVYKLCENYSRHVRGGIAKTWRYVSKNLDRAAADALFARRTK